MRTPDETVRCEGCGSPLNYDRFKKVWVAEELYPDAAKCWKPREGKYEHVPKGDVGRLLRAARRWNERKLPVD